MSRLPRACGERRPAASGAFVVLVVVTALCGASCRSGSNTGPEIAHVVIRGEALQPIELMAEDLARMDRHTAIVEGQQKPVLVEGVLVADLLRRVAAPLDEQLRGAALELYVVVEGADGYRAVFGLAEFDPGISDDPILLIDRQDGQPLPPGDGPLRVVVPAEKRQVRWVRQTVRIVIGRIP